MFSIGLNMNEDSNKVPFFKSKYFVFVLICTMAIIDIAEVSFIVNRQYFTQKQNVPSVSTTVSKSTAVPQLEEGMLETDHIQKDTAKLVKIKFYQKYLLPDSMAIIELNSKPITTLKKIKVNDMGIIDTEITIPNSVKVGQYEVHLLSQSIGENPIDLYAPLFVAGANGDVDEDGIPDIKDKCFFVQQANVDADEDGIDDGCDGNIIKETP